MDSGGAVTWFQLLLNRSFQMDLLMLLSMVGGEERRDERSFLDTDSNVDRYLAGLPLPPTSLPIQPTYPLPTPLDNGGGQLNRPKSSLIIFLMELLCSKR